MITPFSYSRRLRPYAEQIKAERADLARRRRNRVIACIALAVIAAVVLAQLWRQLWTS